MKQPAYALIQTRLKFFQSFKNRPDEDWFSELCFCILTANSKAKTAIEIQEALGCKGFALLPKTRLAREIRRRGHRFHNVKAGYIVEARKHLKIKSIMSCFDDAASARDWLVKNVKGLGMKEASHFLRNTGQTSLAILDRHILSLMAAYSLIEDIPKSLSPKKYEEIERILSHFASKAGMSQAELDLALWYMKTGEVLK